MARTPAPRKLAAHTHLRAVYLPRGVDVRRAVAFAGNDVLKIFVRSQIVSARDPDMIVKHLVPFVVAGLTSPPLR